MLGKGQRKLVEAMNGNWVVNISNIINKDSWYHVFGLNNAADTPARVCKINDFERWFDGPQFLYK